MNVDDFVEDYDVRNIAELRQWRQGLLVPTWIGAYVAETDPDDRLSHPFEGVQDRADETVRFVAVVSQTCDVVGDGPGGRHPFVQVSPVVDVSGWDSGKIDSISRGEINDYVLLTAPPKPDAKWAIDLRVTWPLSKTALARCAPSLGFSDLDEERAIGAHLARKFERPALPDAISTAAARRLRSAVERGMKNEKWAEDVVQLRIDVIAGTVLEPREVRLYVISEVELNPASKREFRAAWKECRQDLEAEGITFRDAAFRNINTMSAREYRDSLLLHMPKLSGGSRDRAA